MKLFNLKRFSATIVAVMIGIGLINGVSAQEQASIQSLVREDVVAVASADLAKVNHHRKGSRRAQV